MTPSQRIQLQFQLPYHREPRSDERVLRYLDAGLRIVHLQRLSDQEVVITFEGPAPR